MTNQTEVAIPNPAPIPTQTNSTPIWLVVAIAALISATSSYATWYALRSQSIQQPAKVVVVDMSRIAVIKGFTAASGGVSAETAAKEFLATLDGLNKAYEKQGILVINAHAAFNRPLGSDMTSQYAKALGVDLNQKLPN